MSQYQPPNDQVWQTPTVVRMHPNTICFDVEYIAAIYADMRLVEAQTEQPHSYTTARTLLSILRLSQGLARLRLDDVITQVWEHTVPLILTTDHALETPKAWSKVY